jgi:hypothetical protein
MTGEPKGIRNHAGADQEAVIGAICCVNRLTFALCERADFTPGAASG